MGREGRERKGKGREGTPVLRKFRDPPMSDIVFDICGLIGSHVTLFLASVLSISIVIYSNCSPDLEAQQCIATAMSSSQCQFTDTEHPRVIELQRQIAAMNTAVDFVCRDNVEGNSFIIISVLIFLARRSATRCVSYSSLCI